MISVLRLGLVTPVLGLGLRDGEPQFLLTSNSCQLDTVIIWLTNAVVTLNDKSVPFAEKSFKAFANVRVFYVFFLHQYNMQHKIHVLEMHA